MGIDGSRSIKVCYISRQSTINVTDGTFMNQPGDELLDLVKYEKESDEDIRK